MELFQEKTNCAMSPPLMKGIAVASLILGDVEVTLMLLSLLYYWTAGKFLAFGIVSASNLLYASCCFAGEMRSYHFMNLMREKVTSGNLRPFDFEDVEEHFKDEKTFRKAAEEKNVPYIFYAEHSAFKRSVVRFNQSVPYFRTAYHAIESQISPPTFAGFLNAQAFYSFTTGVAQQGFSCFNLYTTFMDGRDLSRILLSSLAVGILTTVLTFSNLCLDFPNQFAKMEQIPEEKQMLLKRAYQKVERICSVEEEDEVQDAKQQTQSQNAMLKFFDETITHLAREHDQHKKRYDYLKWVRSFAKCTITGKADDADKAGVQDCLAVKLGQTTLSPDCP